MMTRPSPTTTKFLYVGPASLLLLVGLGEEFVVVDV